MAIDFPDSPSNNDIYTVNGKRWIYSNGKWSIYGSTAPDATASDTEPTGVGDGHIWYRSDQSQTLIRYDNTWVEVGSAGGFDSSSTNFPTSLDSATGFAAVEALQAKVGVDGSAVTTSIDYQLNTGYRYHSTVYFTSSGTFTKASYPWLRAIRVKVQGAGGGGGGTDYAGGTPIRAAGASGGHAGTFAESFITDIASLVASVTVTVGSGGSGGAGGTSGSTAGSDGSAGTDSSFGNGAAYEVSGVGGRQGLRGADTNVKYGTASLDYLGSPGVGDIVIPGSAGGVGISSGGGDGETYATGFGGVGGHSVLGHSNRQSMARTNSNTAQDGLSGNGYGSGGCGGAVAGTAQDGATGGDGANGIVILELFA